MAFFKFPWSGARDTADRDKPQTRRSRAAQAESVEDMRRRARHRLMGAVALVIVAVVGLPMVFDSQPRPIAVDVAIDIPSRQNAPPLAPPGTQQPKTAAPTARQEADKDTGLSAGEEVVASRSRPAPRAEPAHDAPPASKPDARADAKAQPPQGSGTPAGDGARARALLEGKPPASDAPAAPQTERFIVQVGAFADADKVREVRARLERSGLKTYAQEVQTKDGKRTRVRLGPFASRADADKALARAKALGLDGAVLTL